MNFAVNDEVVIKRKTNRTGPLTQEVIVGQIAAFSDEHTAVVNLPLAGGRMERREIAVSQLEPVKKVFGRTAVQMNPLHRQIARRSY